jgi:multidrug resistance efflux pump
MRRRSIIGLVILGCAVTVPGGVALLTGGAASRAANAAEGSVLVSAGKTQPAPGKAAKIAPAVLHPVEQVLVAVGDRVKKGQEVVKIDEDEPAADMRARKAAVVELEASLARLKAEPREHDIEEAAAALDTFRVAARANKQLLDRLEPAWKKGSISEQYYHDVRTDAARAEADAKAAEARLKRLQKRPYDQEVAELTARVVGAREALKSAEAELEHYTVTAPIDGIITSLDVVPGTVSRPGTTVWGEILDLSVIDVRCDVTPGQADQITPGQEAEVVREGRSEVLKGQVVNVGIAADRQTGKIPVLVRLKNPDNRLRCYIDVKVRFPTTAANP